MGAKRGICVSVCLCAWCVCVFAHIQARPWVAENSETSGRVPADRIRREDLQQSRSPRSWRPKFSYSVLLCVFCVSVLGIFLAPWPSSRGTDFRLCSVSRPVAFALPLSAVTSVGSFACPAGFPVPSVFRPRPLSDNPHKIRP